MDNKVLAKVNGIEITENDVNLLMRSLDPQVAMQFYSPEGKAQLLDELVNQELFYCDAIDNNLEEDEEFKAEIERMKRIGLKQYALRKVLNTAKVAEDEVEKFYKEHRENFLEEESVSASHILVKTEEEAKELLEKIKSGVSFEDVAKEHSTCPSSSRGGELGNFTRGKMVPEFEEAAFSMKVGDVSEAPVKTQFGFHLIKVTDKQPAGIKAFDEVKQEIFNTVLSLKQQEKYLEKSKELKEKYKVEITE